MKRVGFRGRLFAILLAFALVPSILIAVAWNATGSFVLPLVSGTAAWDSVALSGERAIAAARTANLTEAQSKALDAHEQTLRESVLRSRQANFVFREAATKLALATLALVAVMGAIANSFVTCQSFLITRPSCCRSAACSR